MKQHEPSIILFAGGESIVDESDCGRPINERIKLDDYGRMLLTEAYQRTNCRKMELLRTLLYDECKPN
jgi:hypothetical protein